MIASGAPGWTGCGGPGDNLGMDDVESANVDASRWLPWGSVSVADCLEVAVRVRAGSVDLVYADPPFFTKRDFSGGGDGESLGFTDRWSGVEKGRAAYLGWLEPRIVAMRGLLKPTGVFCCTWTGMLSTMPK